MRVSNLIKYNINRDNFSLFTFQNKWKEYVRGNEDNTRLTKRTIRINDSITNLWKLTNELNIIISRLNDEINRLVNYHNNTITNPPEYIEEPKLIGSFIFDIEGNFSYLPINVKSLYIWIMMILDRFPLFIMELYKYRREKIGLTTYHEFRDGLKKVQDSNLIKLDKILGGYDPWFTNIHNIRNLYIIHWGKMTLSGIGFSDKSDFINLVLSTRHGNVPQNKVISNETINSDILLLRAFFRDLNDYLISIITDFPL